MVWEDFFKKEFENILALGIKLRVKYASLIKKSALSCIENTSLPLLIFKDK